MNKKVLNQLEFDKITSRLAEFASSSSGKELCHSLLPDDDEDSIRTALGETSDASSRIYANGMISFAGIKDIRPYIIRLESGSSLGIQELLDIASLLSAALNAAAYGNKDTRNTKDSLHERFESLNPVSDLYKEINRCIISDNEIADDASTGLKTVRRQIRTTNDRIKSELSHMLSGSIRSYLQEAVITTRDGRYCIPVKAEYRSQVPGMVHDQSNTGSTFFIEPMSIVRLNNDLRELEISESEEISKILASLSMQASAHTAELLSDYSLLTELDFIFAKGAFANSINGSEPIMSYDGIINIRKGRHPLIPPSSVVPVDVRIGNPYDQLIITGPNTGGKTVTLKTIGLFSLMGQAGLHVPALDNTKLTIFKEIYADIGDEQSIEQSLSTFSSHMKNIVNILKHSSADCLVLFDELCAGTDPTEGAALAISILTHLHQHRVTTVATTHYSELKIYALSTDGVENACCEFDVATLTPTYRLLIGIPGKSNAFAISGRLGLPDNIIEYAKSNISIHDKAFEDVITDLENSRITIEKEQAEIELYKKEIEELKNRLKVKNMRLDERSEDILSKAREDASIILREAKETADEAIRKFNKAAINGMSIQDMESERNKIRKCLDKTNTPDRHSVKNPAAGKHSAGDFHIGDKVHVISMNLDGTVHTLPDSKGNLTVSLGILNSKVNIKDLIILEEASETDKLKDRKSGIGKLKMNKTSMISPEINLIGMNSDEAVMALDKYMDDAFIAHLSPVRIVHGKGAGVLRNAVHNYLRHQKHVKSFRLGSFGEGDYGVTIVEFKD